MNPLFRTAAALGMAGLVLLGWSSARADGGQQTFCVDRPASFDPLFKPSGCFTYKPVEGGVTVIGHALLGSEYLGPGGSVEARVNGTSCGSTTVPGANGVFVLPMAGGNSQAGCATGGDRVDFYLDGVLADQTLDWPSAPGPNPRFLSLSAVNDVAWYWFDRVAIPAARIGTRVEALSNGALCGEAMIGGEEEALGTTRRPNERGFLRLIVSSTKASCGQAGSLVEFRIGGLAGETAVPWRPGVQRLDLQVQADADCSFSIDARDATLVLQHVAGFIASTPCSADANHDHAVNALDAQLILQYAAGLTGALPE